MSTRFIFDPTWNGVDGFEETLARDLWSSLPTQLRGIAAEEIRAGNVPGFLQRDADTGAVLLGFRLPPRTATPDSPNITVHTCHGLGNYCYEDTFCTYEFGNRQAFLAFEDPTFDREVAHGIKDAP